MIANYTLAWSGKEIYQTSTRAQPTIIPPRAPPRAPVCRAFRSVAKVSRASVDKHSFRCSALSDRRPCFTRSAQMDHRPPTDGPKVTLDSTQCTQPKHKPLSCPDKYKHSSTELNKNGTGKEEATHLPKLSRLFILETQSRGQQRCVY